MRLEVSRFGQVQDTIGIRARRALDDVLEGGTPLNSGGELGQVPQLGHEAEDTGMSILHIRCQTCTGRKRRVGYFANEGCARERTYMLAVVNPAMLEGALADPRRDEERGDADAEAVEVEGDLFSVCGTLGVRDVVSGRDTDCKWISNHLPTHTPGTAESCASPNGLSITTGGSKGRLLPGGAT